MNIPAPKIGALEMGPKTQNCDILENGSSNLNEIVVIYGDHLPKYDCVGDIFRKMTVPTLGAQVRNVDFIVFCCLIFSN
jgi:hypothetical protein